MVQIRRWLAVLALAMPATFGSLPAAADDTDTSEVGAYILQAEMALQRKDYRMAAREYRKAADLSDDPELAKQATMTAMFYGFDREALAAAKRWHKLDKQSNEARMFLAQLSFRTGDVKSARRHFAHLVEQGGEPPGEALLIAARHLSEEDDAESADKLMRSLARPYPDSATAHYAVATLSLQAGDTEYALQRAARSIELNPDELKPRLLYGRALLADGQVDEAIEYVARIIGDDPDPDPDARMELAIMYLMVDRPDDALSQVNQVLLEHYGRMDALRLMGIINLREGNYDAAWDDFHDLLDSAQYQTDALFYLGRIADIREETDRAIRFYSEVRRGSNAMAAQQRAAALLAHQNDDLQGALELLDTFSEESPGNAVDVIRAKAQLLVSVKEYDQALGFYDRAVGQRPDDERAALGRAELMLRMDRLDDALEAYADAVRRWPKSATALNAYGYTLADRTDRYREAEKLIRKALRYEPDNAAIIDSMGWVLFKLGRYEKALAELERAYALMPDHEVAAHVVETLFMMGREDEALERLLAAETKTPDSELLAGVRARLFGDDG
jgi:tetratricopeptide (TPR) repeat protein